MSFPAARPTLYCGIAMRSRLEATFAQWLDACGVAWTYEPRAYAAPRGQYLPDFEVQRVGGGRDLFEIRPTVDRALLALEQLEIVLESDAYARLYALVPGVGYFWWSARRERWLWQRDLSIGRPGSAD